MKIKNVSCILIALIVVFGSCKRKETTEVSGTVYDYGSKKPVVQSIEITLDGYSMTVGNKTVATAVTDANGNYYIKYEGRYTVTSVSADASFSTGDPNYLSHADVEDGEANKRDLYLYQVGKILVKVHNTTPFDDSDYLYVYGGMQFIGTNVDTSIYISEPANTTSIVSYRVIKYGHDTILQSPKIYVPLDSVPIYEIDY